MNLDKRGLDERQRALRNRIGHQCFMLLLYGILFDTALNGAGITWLPYPANMMALLTVCAGIYQARIIMGNAYLPPGEKTSYRRRKTIILAAFSVTVAAAAAFVIVKNSTPSSLNVPDAGDNSALVLFIISAVSLVIALVAGLIQRKRDKERDEE